MFARKTAPLIATCAVSAFLWACDDDAEPGADLTPRGEQPSRAGNTAPRSDTSAASRRDAERGNSEYQAEIARIDAARPDKHREGAADPAELIRKRKKVKMGHGYVYVPRHPKPPRRTATAAVRGCDSRTYADAEGPVNLPIPQPPGVTAKRIGPTRILVTYRIAGGDEKCRAEWILVRADVSADVLGGIVKRFAIDDSRSGQIVLSLIDPLANADVLVASTTTALDRTGVDSRTTRVRIR
jgi:hypothetical protein